MAFIKKLWKDRISQFPNRRTINDGSVTKQVTVGRDEGTITEPGDSFDASNMNDLEQRIEDAYGDVVSLVASEVAVQYHGDVIFDNVPTTSHGVGYAVTSDGVKTALDSKADTSILAPVATSGDYDDLINTPSIPAAQIQSDWSQSDNTKVDYIKNKPTVPGNATELPISGNDPTDTKSYIDTAISTLSYNPKCLKVAVIQASLPTSYTIVNNANTTVINNANIKTDNILSSFAVGSLDDIPDNLLGCVFQWANGAVCVSTDTLVMGGKLTLTLRSLVTSQSISAVRLLCIGYDN